MVTVVPPDTWTYALRLPHDPRAARVARMTVRAALNGHGMDEVLDAVELLTSELVTNAYRHTRGPASLRLTALGDGRLRVGVWDRSPYIPAPFDKPPGDRIPPPPDGRGRWAWAASRTGICEFVGRLAARWRSARARRRKAAVVRGRRAGMASLLAVR
ncbi:ATP-binding protein [Streptomyces phaeochromogenes]